jgi:hypothetical protein
MGLPKLSLIFNIRVDTQLNVEGIDQNGFNAIIL